MHAFIPAAISDEAAAGILVGGMLGTIVILCLVLYVLLVIALWKIFKKMGEPGWKSIIPFYNLYIQYKHTWKPYMMWVVLILAFIGGVLAGLGTTSDGGHTFMYTVGEIFQLASCITIFMGEYYLYKSFGHGIGWFILSIFFPNIVTLVLGFGSSQYIGNGSEMQ